MPIYEYHCPKCGNSFELMININADSSKAECPNCSAMADKKISRSGYILKGSGFYNTDYRKNQAECPNKASCPHGAGCAE